MSARNLASFEIDWSNRISVMPLKKYWNRFGFYNNKVY